MNKKQFNKLAPVRFTHFSRNGYALFAVTGREVLIGVLSVASLTFAKADGISVETALSADSLSRVEVKLDEVIVTGTRAPLTELQTARIVTIVTRDDIARSAAASVNDVLKLVPGVDVRQRGGFGVQTDISVRGGNFDQITILLNGINISSPQTGHHSADFPLSPDDIERIEVLEGGYENGLCGVVNIITRKTKTFGNEVKAHLQGGSYGYGAANGSIGYSQALAKGWATDGLFSSGYMRSDGATDNSAFSYSRLFYNANLRAGRFDIAAQAGYSYKPYEANTFYGTASQDQWESNEHIMSALQATQKFSAGNIEGAFIAQAYWNRWFDHYQWHRHNPAGENFHKVDARGASVSTWLHSPLGKTSIGGDLRHEAIWSTKLGQPQEEKLWQHIGGHDAKEDVFYKCHDSRIVADLHANHDILLRQWTMSLGLTANHTRLSHWHLLPSLNIAYRPEASWKLFASWSIAMRQPTFTDLYYSGANIEGNSQLRPEKTSDFQIGARKTNTGFSAEVMAFYSHKTSMIDWVDSGDGVFRSVNFRLNNWGGELNLTLLPQEIINIRQPLRKATLKYAFIDENSHYGVTVVQSKYAMEYLRHKLVIGADCRLYKHLNLNVSWRWQERIISSNGDDSYGLLDARLSWDMKHIAIYADGTNILNKKYFDFISIPQPGTVVMVGVKFYWN